MGPGGLWCSSVLNLPLPPQSLRPDTRLEHQDPVRHMTQKKREKKRKEEKIIITKKIIKIKNKKIIKKSREQLNQ